jgi:hypothetical protein
MVDKAFITYFKLAHGSFNMTMLVLFCWQAWLGYRIRQARLAGAQVPFDAVKRHRRFGPVFALGGVLGFFAGAITVLLDKGRVFEYPLHFVGGVLLVSAIGTVYLLSRRISGQDRSPRNAHFAAGVLLIVLYATQVLMGLSILL